MREKFEKHILATSMVPTGGASSLLERTKDGAYLDGRVQSRWESYRTGLEDAAKIADKHSDDCADEIRSVLKEAKSQ